jgi:hypothetical protein
MGEYHAPAAALGREEPVDFPSSRKNASEENRKLSMRKKMANEELNLIGGLTNIG